MNIAIIGNNKTLEFFINILIKNNQVKWYKTNYEENKFDINKKLIQKNFYKENIDLFDNFNLINKKTIDIKISEIFIIKDKIKFENYINFDDYKIIDNKYNYIPNLEILLDLDINIKQISIENDIVIIDTSDEKILNQINIKNKYEINNYKIICNNEELNISIDKNKVEYNYVNEYSYIKSKKEIKNKKIIEVIKGFKKEKYSYGKICVINNSLKEYSNSFQDYTLITEIINKSNNKNLYYNIDIYSNIKINLY